jgi:hypothetical protein
LSENQKPLILGLSGALGLALLTIAFLAGRVTAPLPPAERVVVVPSGGHEGSSGKEASTDVRAPDTVKPAGEVPPASQSFAPITSAPITAPALRVPPPVPTANGTAGASSPERAAITAYFAHMESVGDLGGGDPQAFAGSLIQSVSSGDFSAFDQLLVKARAQRDQLRGIAPPNACAQYHRLALSLSSDSVAMLERMREALTRGDATALLTLANEGRSMETQANQLKAMGETIRKQAGA